MRPDKIEWAPCPCGFHVCKRQYPTNLGTFCVGTGFEPHEVEWLNEAWEAHDKAESEAAALRERLGEAVEALRPFAMSAGYALAGDDDDVRISVRLDECRRARDLLAAPAVQGPHVAEQTGGE